jgi:SAM-dependent methyltransferase
MTDAFGPVAKDYDGWYESAEGAAIFAAEIRCLHLAAPRIDGRWLEIGVGTGRFASGLNVANGVDLSTPMLRLAAARNISAVVGTGQQLPYRTGTLAGVLMVATLCFVGDAGSVLQECRRVLRPRGALLIGHIPADSLWGHSYIEKGERGHPIYSHARLITISQVLSLAQEAGFGLDSAASTLFWMPDSKPKRPARIVAGVREGAGFVALRLSCSEPTKMYTGRLNGVESGR